MTTKSLYSFDNTASTGVDQVPLNSPILIEDLDGQNTPKLLMITNRAGLVPGTTVAQLLALPDQWTDLTAGAKMRSNWHFTATQGQTVFSIVYDNVDTVDVYIDGSLAKYNLDYTLSNSNTLTLLEPANVNSIVDVYAWNGAELFASPTAIKTEITATEGQTAFTVAYNPTAVDVYSNGVLLLSSDYIASNGTSITLNEPAQAGDVIRVNSNDAAPEDPMTYPTAQDFTATQGQTVFSVTYNPSQVYVYVDGIKLKASEFTASNGTSITLNSGVDAGTWVHVVSNSNSPAIGVNWGMVNGTPTTIVGYGITDALTTENMFLKTNGYITMNDNVPLNLGTGTDASLSFDATNTNMVLSAGDFYIKDGATTRYTFERTTGHFTATGDVTAYSDVKLKENIEVISDAMDKILHLSGYTFDRKDNKEIGRQTGVIAQEVEQVLPEAIKKDENGTLSVAYGNMVGLLIEGIKEQNDIICDLKKRVEELENK